MNNLYLALYFSQILFSRQNICITIVYITYIRTNVVILVVIILIVPFGFALFLLDLSLYYSSLGLNPRNKNVITYITMSPKNFVLNVVILTINMRSLVRMINNANSSPQQFRQKNSHYHFLTFCNRIVVKGDMVLADYKSELKHYVKSTNLNLDMTTLLLQMNSFVQQNWVVSSICF